MVTIKNKLAEHGMTDDLNLYICLNVRTYEDTKFNIYYTSENNIVKLVEMDSF